MNDADCEYLCSHRERARPDKRQWTKNFPTRPLRLLGWERSPLGRSRRKYKLMFANKLNIYSFVQRIGFIISECSLLAFPTLNVNTLWWRSVLRYDDGSKNCSVTLSTSTLSPSSSLTRFNMPGFMLRMKSSKSAERFNITYDNLICTHTSPEAAREIQE